MNGSVHTVHASYFPDCDEAGYRQAYHNFHTLFPPSDSDCQGIYSFLYFSIDSEGIGLLGAMEIDTQLLEVVKCSCSIYNYIIMFIVSDMHDSFSCVFSVKLCKRFRIIRVIVYKFKNLFWVVRLISDLTGCGFSFCLLLNIHCIFCCERRPSQCDMLTYTFIIQSGIAYIHCIPLSHFSIIDGLM